MPLSQSDYILKYPSKVVKTASAFATQSHKSTVSIHTPTSRGEDAQSQSTQMQNREAIWSSEAVESEPAPGFTPVPCGLNEQHRLLSSDVYHCFPQVRSSLPKLLTLCAMIKNVPKQLAWSFNNFSRHHVFTRPSRRR